MAHWGTLIGFIYILSGVSQCQGSYPIFKNDTEKFRNLAVSDSYVYIGGESSIIQIDSKFLNQTKLISISDYPENWLLKVVNMTEEKILVCNYKSKFLYDTTCKIVFGGNETISREIKVKSGLRHVVSLFVQGKTIVFGSSSCLYTTGYEACYAITNLKLSNMAEYKRLSVEYSGGFNAQQLKFLSIFKADKFLYFLFKTEEVSKLGKMCFEDRTITHNLLNSYEDTPIECSHNDRIFREVAGSVIWNSHLFVAFTHGEENIICKYSFHDIGEKYMKSRKERLNCSNIDVPNELFTKQYYDVTRWCFRNGRCIKRQDNSTAECPEITSEDNGFCKTKLFGSVEGQLPINSDIVIHHSNSDVDGGKIVKLGIQDLKTHAIMYVGTSQGTIGKIFVSNYTENEKALGGFRAVQLTFPVLDIQVNRDDVYVMTENTVVNIAEKDPCPNTKYCNVCMESINPICGWYILTGSCKNISTGQARDGLLGFLPSLGRKCLRIDTVEHQVNNGQAIDPVPIVNFQFRFFPPVLPKDMVNNLSCRLKGTSQMSHIAYAVTEEMFSCKLQNVTSGQEVVVLKDENIIAKTEIKLYQCSNITSCYSCVRNRNCSWHLNSFKCSTLSQDDYLVKPNESMNCPLIVNSKPILMHTGETKDLEINVTNAMTFESVQDLRCSIEGVKYNVVYTNDAVKCMMVKTPSHDSNVTIIYKESMVDGYAELKVYKCSEFITCGECTFKERNGYNCKWMPNGCSNSTKNSGYEKIQKCKDLLKISQVTPLSGPILGGTRITIEGKNVGYEGQDINVTLAGVPCINVTVIENSKRITCITGDASTVTSRIGPVVLMVGDEKKSGNGKYQYKNRHTLAEFHPRKAIMAGGRKIRIHGDNITFPGSSYVVRFCSYSYSCLQCLNPSVNGNGIMCNVGDALEEMVLTQVFVTIDDNTELSLTMTLQIVANPHITIPEKGIQVFKSGGSYFNISGRGFENVDTIRVEDVNESNCTLSSNNNTARCQAPPYKAPSYERRKKRSTGQNIGLYFDNYYERFKVYYTDDPKFTLFTDVMEYNADTPLVIKGERLTEGANCHDYVIKVGLDGKCHVETLTNYNITCFPPKNVPSSNYSNEDTVYVIVKVGRLQVHIGDLKYTQEVELLPIIVGTLGACFLLACIGGVTTVLRLKKKKDLAETEFELKLTTMEQRIREIIREVSADAQMTIKDIKSDLVTSRVPYLDYQSYVFHHLFPNHEMETHPVLNEPMITDYNRKRVQEAMDVFSKLLTNKMFLKFIVKTFDSHVKGLTMQDKDQFASLLSAAVIGNMRLFYQLISCLLEDMIKDANKKQQKLLFRRFESITQRLTVNWLVMSLYQHLQNHSGMQLFMLYKATQTVIERGPIDAVTTSCKYTLAQERLLKTRVDCEALRLHIDLNGNSDHKIPVDVLDCDTITQVKHKCCSAIFKNKPASAIPSPDDLELEWHTGKGERLPLKDVDNTSDRDNDMLRLNTLKHYIVRNGSEMALMYIDTTDDQEELYVNQIISMRQQMENLTGSPTSSTSPDSVKLLMQSETTENSDGLKWHLSDLTDEEKSNNEHEIGEIFLNRIFHTKLILKDYIDAAFEGIMDPQFLSVPVRYFLCMLDKQGKDVGVDSDVLLSWKSECYATRVWASLIAKPQLLFDVHVPSHVEPCMDILKQVFIDSFTQNPQHVTKDASPQKLLFCKDIPIYRKQVNSFFHRVESVPDQQFWSVLDDISTMQTQRLKFSRHAVLHQLYKFISKYKDQIFDAFEDEEESKNLDFAKTFEKIAELMEDS